MLASLGYNAHQQDFYDLSYTLKFLRMHSGKSDD